MSGHTYDHCIAVIGAGAAGLAAAKALLAEGFNVTIFERKTGPGGLWNTAPGTGCWPNPVYEGLETNVPRTLMTLSDFPWPTNASLFPTSSCVHQYLQQYLLDMQQSDNGQARLMVWYNTEVTGLRKSTCDKTPCWRIESTERPFGRNPVEKFSQWSAVIVAIGNYHKRWIPQEFLEELGMWDAVFPASLFHSINYRTPEPFRDQTVLVVGNSASGWDISSQLAGVAGTVIVSSKRFSRRLQQQPVSAPTHIAVPDIKFIDAATRSVTFTDDRTYKVDCIIFCTGYAYDFSFIRRGTRAGDEELFKSGLTVENLYEHMLYVPDQSLAFVGLPKMSASFTVAEAQSAVIARLWAGRIKTWTKPKLERWVQDARAEFETQMQTGQARAEDYHSFRLTEDKAYVNRLLDWSMKAEEPTELGDDGQPPPFWCGCLDTARLQIRDVRSAFKEQGEDRHQFATHQSLGFELKGRCEDGIEKLYETRQRCRSCFISTSGKRVHWA